MARQSVIDQGLTQEQVVRVALELLHESGLKSVSMRKVGTRLGVAAPSLYWHVKSKEALHQLMSQAIFDACLESVPQCRHWPQWLREFGLALWHVQHTTPDIRMLILSAPAQKTHTERTTAQVVSKLAESGMPADIARDAQQSVQALVTGWTTLRKRAVASAGDDAFRNSLDALIEGWKSRAGKQG